MFDVEVASHQDRQSPAETDGLVLPDRCAGRRKVSHKDYYRSAGQSDLDGGSLQVRPGMGTEWWTITRRTRMAVPPSNVGLSVRWQT